MAVVSSCPNPFIQANLTGCFLSKVREHPWRPPFWKPATRGRYMKCFAEKPTGTGLLLFSRTDR